jgi:hypothetical protein
MRRQHDEVRVRLGCGVDDPSFRLLELQQIARIDSLCAQPFCEAFEVVAGELSLGTPEEMRGGVHHRDMQWGMRRALFGERRGDRRHM